MEFNDTKKYLQRHENFIDKEISEIIKSNKGIFKTIITTGTNNIKIIENDDSSSLSLSDSSRGARESNKTSISKHKNIFPEVRNNIGTLILHEFNPKIAKIFEKNKYLSKKFKKIAKKRKVMRE